MKAVIQKVDTKDLKWSLDFFRCSILKKIFFSLMVFVSEHTQLNHLVLLTFRVFFYHVRKKSTVCWKNRKTRTWPTAGFKMQDSISPPHMDLMHFKRPPSNPLLLTLLCRSTSLSPIITCAGMIFSAHWPSLCHFGFLCVPHISRHLPVEL